MRKKVAFYNNKTKTINIILILLTFLMLCMVFCFEFYPHCEDSSESVLVVTDKDNVITCYLVYSDTVSCDGNSLSFTTAYGEEVYLSIVLYYHECGCTLEN